MLTLSSQLRTELGKKNRKLRKEGFIPGVLYGEKAKNQHLKINYKDFEKIYNQAGESSLLKLEIEGDNKPKNVLIHDVSLDPVTDKFIHVDFYQVDLTKKIKTHVPLKFIGKSQAVETEGGVFIRNLNEVEVEALPDNLPKEIEVDISSLVTFDNNITVKDLKTGEGVKILNDADLIVASVIPPRSEEELKALEEEVKEEVEGVEVVKEEKKKEEGEEGIGEAEKPKREEKTEEKKE